MKHIMNKVVFSAACLATALLMASCDTDIEAVEINQSGINTQNPELYANYLSNLKKYKGSAHKTVFGWFDNSAKTPASQGQNIHAVPDSLDYLVLTTPGNLNAREMKEMTDLRENKGTKILYEISFETLKAQYDEELMTFKEAEENKGKTFRSFNDYLVDSVQHQLSFCETYQYDGVVMTFEGKQKLYLSEQEKIEVIGLENDFIGIAKDWKERHADKMLVLAGKPQNIIDQTVFELAAYIIVPCQSATTQSGMAYIMNKASADGVPTNKLLPWVTTTTLDESDTKTGYWTNGLKAVEGAAKWAVSEHEAYQIAGLAIDNIHTDYYHANQVYPTVRKAISIINPTVKK